MCKPQGYLMQLPHTLTTRNAANLMRDTLRTPPPVAAAGSSYICFRV
jgi:hypothetical protein